jgi:hypothetical protein
MSELQEHDFVDEICGHCGDRMGLHVGPMDAPECVDGISEFVPTGTYRSPDRVDPLSASYENARRFAEAVMRPHYEFSWPPGDSDLARAARRQWTSLLDVWDGLRDVVEWETWVLCGRKPHLQWRLQNHAPMSTWCRPHNPPRRRRGKGRG